MSRSIKEVRPSTPIALVLVVRRRLRKNGLVCVQFPFLSGQTNIAVYPLMSLRIRLAIVTAELPFPEDAVIVIPLRRNPRLISTPLTKQLKLCFHSTAYDHLLRQQLRLPRKRHF